MKAKPSKKDVLSAWVLLREKLSMEQEKKSRAAARRVLEEIGTASTFAEHEPMIASAIAEFLRTLANAIDPASMPKEERPWTRAIHFKYAGTRTRATAIAFAKNFQIATQVYLLNLAGNKKATKAVAQEYGMTSNQVSKICGRPGIKHAVESNFGFLTPTEAGEVYRNYSPVLKGRKK
jgi:hypothetical protein